MNLGRAVLPAHKGDGGSHAAGAVFFLLVLAAFAVLSLLACFHDSSEEKTLTLATTSEPLTLNLALAKDAGSVDVLGYLFEGLTETSWMTDQIEPSLAESWTHSEDGLTWTFSLREDVAWHDGTPFTAHDVDFTFNRIIYNGEIKPPRRGRRLTSGFWMKLPALGRKQE